jgi:hypothetical protein
MSGRSFDEWVAQLRALVADNWDVCVVVVGYTGVGKSTWAWKIGEAVDDTFHEGRMCLTEGEVWAALMAGERGQVVVVDEGVEVLYARDSMTTTNKDMVRWLDVCRARGLILVVCMSTLRALDARVRDDRAKWAWSVTSRGRARRYTRQNADPMALDSSAVGGTWRARRMARYGPVTGEGWDRYMKRKFDRVMNFDPAAERDRKRSRRRRRRTDDDDDAAPPRRRRRRVRD